jgi:L-threonylcarbamoyladenylate synthase
VPWRCVQQRCWALQHSDDVGLAARGVALNMLRDGRDPEALATAATLLAAGGLVAFPTETVYGLGARADLDAAVSAIFACKGRPADHPLIVHVARPAHADHFAATLPPVARRLMTALWPGPLTLIVPRSPQIAVAAAGGHASIGLRCPAHPVAQALLEAAYRLGVPGLAAPSANRFGRISPTLATHVVAEFGDSLLVLDGGPCDDGIESAIVDCTQERPVLLRPGALTRTRIEDAAGTTLGEPGERAARAPGTLAAHYAPRAKLMLLSRRALQEAVQKLDPLGSDVAVYSRTVAMPPRLSTGSASLWRTMPDRAAEAAHELFAVLREVDSTGVRLIWVEQPPVSPEWEGVCDRLQRAAAG